MNCDHSRLACESPRSPAHEVCDRHTRGCSNGLGTVRSDSKHTEKKACCQILTLGRCDAYFSVQNLLQSAQHLSIMRAVFMSERLSGDRAFLHASMDVSWAAFHLPIRNSSKVESGQYHAETSMLVVSIPRGAASLPSRGASSMKFGFFFQLPCAP